MDAMLEMATLIGDRIAERMEARYQIMPMLTLDQAAKALDISIEKMRQLCNDGKIPFIRMDRLYRIKPADVNAYLEKNYCRPDGLGSVAAERRSKVSARCASASVALTGSASVGGFAASKVSRLTPLGKGRAWLGEEADGADCSDRADESEKQGDEIEAASDEIAALTKELNKIEEEKNQNGNA